MKHIKTLMPLPSVTEALVRMAASPLCPHAYPPYLKVR